MAALRTTRGLGWVGGCLIVFILGIVVVGGLGFFGVRTMLKYGNEEILAAIEGNTVIAEHIGDVEEVEFDLEQSDEMLTGADWDAGWTVWSIRGSKAEGLLKAQFDENLRDDEGRPKLSAGILIVGAKEYDLFPDGVPSKDEKVEGPGKPEQPSQPEKPSESLPDPK